MGPRADDRAAWGTAGLTAAAMLAFAANSLLCRAALGGGHADAASFTILRLAAGALVLFLFTRVRRSPGPPARPEWGSALALFAYAIGFSRATPLALAASVIGASFGPIRVDPLGAGLALASGAVASGMGYALWYAALQRLTAIRAALVQLSVPPLAAGAGVLLLGESLSPRLSDRGRAVSQVRASAAALEAHTHIADDLADAGVRLGTFGLGNGGGRYCTIVAPGRESNPHEAKPAGL
jgi:drug/metabolite transporter (DMT)-like permease